MGVRVRWAPMDITPLPGEMRRLDELTPYAGNAKMHPASQVTKIALAIKEFGFCNPILIEPNGGVIAGHGRIKALVQLGCEPTDLIPCTVYPWPLDDAKRAALVQADNIVAEAGGWDTDMAKRELRLIRDAGDSNLLNAIGYEDKKLLAMLRDDEPGAGTGDGGNMGNPVIAYNIVFDDAEQQAVWFDFLRRLKDRYPGEDHTIASRLVEFLGAYATDF